MRRFFLLATLSAACAGDPAGTPSPHGLGEPVAYSTGSSGLTRLVAANLVGDQRLDLFSVARGDLSIRLLAGVGEGKFADAVAVIPGNDARDATTGDVNGDGIPDLLVAGHLDNTLRVKLGKGGGQFADPVTYPLRNHGAYVAVTRLNQDAFEDVIVVHDGSGQPIYVNTYLGSASGALQLQASIGTDYATAVGLSAGDFDGDGQTDFAVATGDERASVLVFRGLGDGTVASPTTIPTTASDPLFTDGTRAIAVGDLNRDGRDDIVLVCFDFSNQLVAWLGGSSGFTGPAITPLPSPVDVALGDLNGDGMLDAVIANLEQGNVGVLLGNGHGSFQDPAYTTVGAEPSTLVVADFDGNGRADVAVADLGDNLIRVLLSS